MSRQQTPHRHQGTRRAARRLLWLALFVCAAGLDARASSPCVMGAPLSATAPTIDGQRLNEWDDAVVITSGEPCLEQMLDFDQGMMTSRNVRVYIKRYMRAGVAFIGFFFEVPDATNTGPCPNMELCKGERIALLFDPDISRGVQFVHPAADPSTQNDYEIIFTHKWKSAGGSVIDVNEVPLATYRLSSMPLCNPPELEPFTPAGAAPTWAARSDLSPGPGYTAEIEVPLSFLGFSGMPAATTNLGFAFGVVNDLGNSTPMACTSNDVCPGYGVSFPKDLPMTNDANPLNQPCNNGNWGVPDNWGTLTFGVPPGIVSVSRSPDYWSNDGLLVYQCGDNVTTYRYYDDHPCQARLVANVNNSTASPQTRNVLFLWSPVGAGEPANYNLVELVQNVTLPPHSIKPVSTQAWTGVPKNQHHHPCVRVYLLKPPLMSGSGFPQSGATTATAADIASMVSSYGISLDEWTQKNISEITGQSSCPDMNCQIASNGANGRAPGGDAPVEIASAAPVRWEGSLFALASEGAAQTPADVPLRVLYAPPGGDPPPPLQTSAASDHPPVVKQPGRNILMDGEEFRRFSRDHVIVQVRAFGYRKPPAKEPRYNFLEKMGGVIQLIPTELLRSTRSVPFQFNVTNGGVEHTIFLVVDLYTPSGVSQAQVALDTSQHVYAPNENQVVKGVVILPGTPPPPPGGGFKRWGLSLHAGVSFPHGNFDTAFNPGPNFAVDLEYRLTQTFSLEGIYGFHRFRGETFGSVTVGDVNLHQFSLNGKVYGSSSPVRPFFNFGGGVYHFGAVGTTNGGINVGGGLQFDVTPTFAVEGVYNFHNVFTSGSNTRFSTLQGGVRIRF